jgi:hypothetical protein
LSGRTDAVDHSADATAERHSHHTGFPAAILVGR